MSLKWVMRPHLLEAGEELAIFTGANKKVEMTERCIMQNAIELLRGGLW